MLFGGRLMAASAAISVQTSSPLGQVQVSNTTLNSWKEIAVYLGRGVRTVQRWECELNLPVYRIRETEHSPVFAYTSELDLWLENRSKRAVPRVFSPRPKSIPGFHRGATVDRCKKLAATMADLVTEHADATERLKRNLQVTVATLRRLRQVQRGPATTFEEPVACE